jgi:arylsulfatase A-like enzyme
LYEGGLRVPLVIRWPGVQKTPGAVLDTPVVSMDLSATILDAAKVIRKSDETADGVTLRPVLQGQPLDRGSLYFHYPHFAFHRANRPGGAVRSGNYKLIRHYDDNSVELFDLAQDIGETRNLALAQPDVAAKLDAQLGRWLEATGAQMPTPSK